MTDHTPTTVSMDSGLDQASLTLERVRDRLEVSVRLSLAMQAELMECSTPDEVGVRIRELVSSTLTRLAHRMWELPPETMR